MAQIRGILQNLHDDDFCKSLISIPSRKCLELHDVFDSDHVKPEKDVKYLHNDFFLSILPQRKQITLGLSLLQGIPIPGICTLIAEYAARTPLDQLHIMEITVRGSGIACTSTYIQYIVKSKLPILYSIEKCVILLRKLMITNEFNVFASYHLL